MLSINMADVVAVLRSLIPYLVAAGVLLLLAIVITIAVNKKTVQSVGARKMIHAQSWIVALIGIVVAFSMMLTGPMSTLLNNATITKYQLSQSTVAKANTLAKDVQTEAVTMLKNDDANLPLANKKVNVFGWGSTNPVYGGTGSGSMSEQYKTTSLLDGLKESGFQANPSLTKLYTDYRKDRPVVGMFAQDWTLPEVPAAQYSDSLMQSAKDYSDEAVVVITRVGGEGADLPENMRAKGITYHDNSKDYPDSQNGEHFLQLSQTEKDMLNLVTKNFNKVTLVYNGANTFQLDFVNSYPQIRSVLWCPPAAPTNFNMSAKAKAEFTNNGNYKVADHNKSSDAMPTTGAKNGIRLADMHGKSYDDPQWGKLLDQLTFKDMDTLIAMGGYGTQAVKSIGKVQLTDADGPASLNNNFTGVGSIGFPASTAFACTWNRDLAKQFGEMIGQMAHDMHVAGWYAPAQNIHRNAFSGRTFEYFSEDPLLSGVMASSQIAGAKKKGVYSFMKHFAMNDQETNRTEMLLTWSNEQAIRETYLKPFEMSVKEGGASAVMSSFNYIGPVYSGANPVLLKNVLRNEWGFRGFVLTDYFAGYGYQNGDQEIRNGNDSMLATTDITNHVKDKSATSLLAMRQASKNILYTTVNGWQYANGEPKVATPVWRTALYVLWGVTALLVLGFEYLAISRFLKRRKAAESVGAGAPAETPASAEV